MDPPECQQCLIDTYRICATDFGCEAIYTDWGCCIEGLCPFAPDCEECADLDAALTECWERAGPTCEPRFADCIAGL